MKIITEVGTIIAFVLLCSGIATAQSWQVIQTGNEKLPVSYVYDKCIVMPSANGKGLTIVATDPDWPEGHLTQLIIINQGGVKLDLRRRKGRERTEATAGYDIFGAKCADAAKSLPQEVKPLFFGHYVS